MDQSQPLDAALKDFNEAMSTLGKTFADALNDAAEQMKLALSCKMRRFYLVRNEDSSGVSGTGIVAEGVLFEDGTVAMRWKTRHKSSIFYATIADVEAIHGHGSKSVVKFIDAVA